jgi:diaminohydroxyphosphoribosylaminopyrimidine deaminase/5-amino-6-(5-phosphoribosylamino)uracil reductase
MQEAIALARLGLGFTRPNPPVGAVVVKRGRIIGQGHHRMAGGPHAEVEALAEAGARSPGSTLYVTLEPCSTQGRTPPCTRAIMAAGITRVVTGSRDPNPKHAGRGLKILRQAGISVVTGVCQAETDRLMAPFDKWITMGQPFLTLKMAATLDGRIADSQGRSQWITGTAAREHVQMLRRHADAVMVGSGTALTDNPSLLCRQPDAPTGMRIIVDSRGRLPLDAQVLTDGRQARTIVATTGRCPRRKIAALRATGARVWTVPETRGHVSLPQLMRRLGKAGLLHVLCEGGGGLAEALLRSGLVDECLWFIAPKLLGGKAVPVLGGSGWSLAQAPTMALTDCERGGEDLRLRTVPGVAI